MELLQHLFTREPLLALFTTIALSYVVGKIKIGSFVLGGIGGTLLVGGSRGRYSTNTIKSLRNSRLHSQWVSME
jgi:uncharacterized transporter YbjL